MDDEWLNDESTLTPPDDNPDDDFLYSFEIDPDFRNFLNAKRGKTGGKKKTKASSDPSTSPPPQLKPQQVKCNTVDDLRRILFQRYGRGLIGRVMCDNMDVLLMRESDRSSTDTVTGWRMEPVSVVDMACYFYIKQDGHMYFFVGTEQPEWIKSNKNYFGVSRSLLDKLTTKKKATLIVARLGFHMQVKADYDSFVAAVRAPENTDRAGFAAQVNINAIIAQMQAAHPHLSRQLPSSWQQWASEIAALPRDRHARAIERGPPPTLPFVRVATEAERRLADTYEANVFLEHVAKGAADSFKKVDEFLEQFIIDATKDFEQSLRASASKVKEEIAKAAMSLSAQAEVARWNSGRLAPPQPGMPSSLVAPSARGHQAHELRPEDDLPDTEHQESGDEVGDNDVDEDVVDDDGDESFLDEGPASTP